MQTLHKSRGKTDLSQIRQRFANRCAACIVTFVVLGGSAGGLVGCASPAQRMDSAAAASGLERSVVDGLDYRHVVYRNLRPGPELHVYIDNDGSPWSGRYSMAAEPTGTGFSVLALMAADPAPAVYLGRPCYLGLAVEPPCTPLTWTHERYSLRAVDSMEAALRRVLEGRPAPRLVFVGHSGGGTLAVLLAPRFEQTAAVVTLAANLDLRAWVQKHGYTPLRGSTDPIDEPPIDSGILQMHFVGDLDGNVTAAMLRRYAQTHSGAEVRVVPGMDHVCCWTDAWPSLLRDVQTEMARWRLPRPIP